MEERWARGGSLVDGGPRRRGPRPGRHLPAAVRPRQPRPLGDARAAGPAEPGVVGATVARRRLHRRAAGVRRLRRRLRDRGRRPGAVRRPHRGVRARPPSCACSTTRRTSGTSRPPSWSSETDGRRAAARRCSRPHLKDPYTHELEHFHAAVTGAAEVKTTPEDYVEDMELFVELIRHRVESGLTAARPKIGRVRRKSVRRRPAALPSVEAARRSKERRSHAEHRRRRVLPDQRLPAAPPPAVLRGEARPSWRASSTSTSPTRATSSPTSSTRRTTATPGCSTSCCPTRCSTPSSR